MDIQKVALSELIPDPANVRTHAPTNLKAIAGSLQRFGQQKPIVVNNKNIIVAGNGTYEAAMALNWETIDCVFTGLEGPEAIAYAIADNRTAELAEWDFAALGAILHELDSDLLDAVGFDQHDLDNLMTEFKPKSDVEDLESFTPDKDFSGRSIKIPGESVPLLDAAIAEMSQHQNRKLSDQEAVVLILEEYVDCD